MTWHRLLESGGVTVWELTSSKADRLMLVRWTIYRVQGRTTHNNPTGEYWRAQRNGETLRANQRVRSWLSRHAAMGAVEELARLGL